MENLKVHNNLKRKKQIDVRFMPIGELTWRWFGRSNCTEKTLLRYGLWFLHWKLMLIIYNWNVGIQINTTRRRQGHRCYLNIGMDNNNDCKATIRIILSILWKLINPEENILISLELELRWILFITFGIAADPCCQFWSQFIYTLSPTCRHTYIYTQTHRHIH